MSFYFISISKENFIAKRAVNEHDITIAQERYPAKRKQLQSASAAASQQGASQ